MMTRPVTNRIQRTRETSYLSIGIDGLQGVVEGGQDFGGELLGIGFPNATVLRRPAVGIPALGACPTAGGLAELLLREVDYLSG
jgi:hypothetical protein